MEYIFNIYYNQIYYDTLSMPKITVVSTERPIKDIYSYTREEFYNVLTGIYESGGLEYEEVESFISLYDKCHSSVRPSIHDMPEILVRYILTKSYITPVVDINNTDDGIPWLWWMPKNVPSGALRLQLDSRKEALVRHREYKIFIPSGVFVDIHEFVHKGMNIPISGVTYLFNYVISREEYKSSYSKLLRDIMSSSYDVNSVNDMSGVSGKDESKDVKDKSIRIKKSELTLLKMMHITNSRCITNENLYSVLRQLFSDMQLLELKLDMDVEQYIDDINRRVEIGKHIKDQKTHAYEESIRYNFILKEIGKLFPNNTKALYSRTAHEALGYLNDSEKAVILTAYDEYLQYCKMVEENKCPHITLISKLNYTRSIFIKIKILDELLTMSSENQDGNSSSNKKSNSTPDDDYYKCSVCGFNLICPHVVDKCRLEATGLGVDDINKKMDKYGDVISSDKEVLSKVCKICGEELFKYDNDVIMEENYKTMFYDINKYMWSSCMNIYGTLIIYPMMDPYLFASHLVRVLMPIIINTSIPSVKTAVQLYNKTNELSPGLQVYIILYIYGFILSMIKHYQSSPEKGNKFTSVSLKEKGKTTSISNITESIILRFGNIHSYVYSYTEGIDLVNELLNIFVEVNSSPIHKYIEIPYSKELVTMNNIRFNTTYRYALSIARLFVTIPLSYRDEVDLILGKSIEELISVIKSDDGAIKIADTIWTPPLDNNGKEFSDYHKYLIESYIAYIQYIKTGEYNFKDLDKLKALSTLYDKRMFIINGSFVSCLNTFAGKYKQSVWHNPVYKKWTLAIDENGLPHVWKILIDDKGNEITIGEKSDNSKVVQSVINVVDHRCTICGVKKSEISSINEELSKTNYSLRMNVFFLLKMYKIECPEGGFHEFVEGVCKNCSIESDVLHGVKEDDQALLIWATKYRNRRSNKNAKRKNNNDNGNDNGSDNGRDDVENDKDSIFADVTGEIEDNWTYNAAIVLEAAKIGLVSVHFFESLGAMIGVPFNDIMNGNNRRDWPTHVTNLQINVVKSYIIDICTYYNNLRDVNNIIDVYEYDVRKLLLDMKYPDTQWPSLKKLPDITLQYINMCNIAIKSTKLMPRDVYLYLVQLLAKLILDLPKQSNSEIIKAILIKFQEDMCKYVVFKESTTCKAGSFDPAIFIRRKNVNAYVEMGLVFDVVYEEEINKEDEGEYINDIDYTGYNDTID